jgi:hypothetical protein
MALPPRCDGASLPGPSCPCYGPPPGTGGHPILLRDAIHTLKLDRRLATRRGWIEETELTRALADLPDVKAKAAEPAAPPAAAADEPPANS